MLVVKSLIFLKFVFLSWAELHYFYVRPTDIKLELRTEFDRNCKLG